MRPQVEEIEDDLAAEEENKNINEVRLLNVVSTALWRTQHFCTGIQNMVSLAPS